MVAVYGVFSSPPQVITLRQGLLIN